MSGRNVLIVDDDRDLANSLAEVCRLSGHRVRVAFSGNAAIRAVEEGPCDLALVDFALPDVDGTQVAAEIQRRAPRAEIRVMTGYGVDFVRAHARGPFVDAIMTKPLDVEVLLRHLETMGEEESRRPPRS